MRATLQKMQNSTSVKHMSSMFIQKNNAKAVLWNANHILCEQILGLFHT